MFHGFFTHVTRSTREPGSPRAKGADGGGGGTVRAMLRRFRRVSAAAAVLVAIAAPTVSAQPAPPPPGPGGPAPPASPPPASTPAPDPASTPASPPPPASTPGPLADAERILDFASEHFEEARELRDVLRLARELAYADPRQVEWAIASAYGDLLADPIMGPLLSNLVAQYRGGFARLDVDAGAATDVDLPAAANVSVAAAYELPLCRVVGARAAGLGGWAEGGAIGSYVLTGSACLPLPANTLEFAYTRRGNVRTSLTAAPVVLRERRTGDIYDINIRFWRWRGEHHQVDVMPFAIHIDVTRDEDGGGFGAISSSVDGAPAVWRRRGKGLAGDDQVWRFMGFSLTYQDDDAAVGGRDAGVFTLWPLTMDGVHVTRDLVAGIGGGFVTARGVDGDVALVEESGVSAYFQLEAARGRVRGSVRAAREYVPTFDAQYVIDDRVTTRVDLTGAGMAGGVSVFAARDEVRRAGERVEPELVTGGSVDAAYALGRGLHVLARIEGAHAIAAGRAADPVAVVGELRASAGVAWHWDRRWPPPRIAPARR